MISAAARMGSFHDHAADSIKSPAIFSLRSTMRSRRQTAESSRLHVHHRDVCLAAFHHLGHPQPLARILAERHANRIRALRTGSKNAMRSSNPVRSVFESQEPRSSRSWRDCESSTAPGPDRECPRSVRPALLPAASIGQASAIACAPHVAKPANPHNPSCHCPDQPHRPHRFSLVLRGLYRLRFARLTEFDNLLAHRLRRSERSACRSEGMRCSPRMCSTSSYPVAKS